MVYAIGAWWVLGSVIFFTRSQKEPGRVPPPGEIGLSASASGSSPWKSPKRRPSLLEPWGSAKLLLAGTSVIYGWNLQRERFLQELLSIATWILLINTVPMFTWNTWIHLCSGWIPETRVLPFSWDPVAYRRASIKIIPVIGWKRNSRTFQYVLEMEGIRKSVGVSAKDWNVREEGRWLLVPEDTLNQLWFWVAQTE